MTRENKAMWPSRDLRAHGGDLAKRPGVGAALVPCEIAEAVRDARELMRRAAESGISPRLIGTLRNRAPGDRTRMT